MLTQKNNLKKKKSVDVLQQKLLHRLKNKEVMYKQLHLIIQ